MPFTIPTLKQQRIIGRNYLMSALPGADALIPNSVLRVMSDNNAGFSHLNLQFLAWLALQLLPITNQGIWLDRWADMYLTNSDGSKGRKQATFATGTITISGNPQTVVPSGSQLNCGNGILYQTTDQVTIGPAGTAVATLIALTAGSLGNLDAGTTMVLQPVPAGVSNVATIITMTGGTDTETDSQLRSRLLFRLANPPMGGDATDYVQWALAVPGVTRAWCSPQELGPGTITLRFMMDTLRATTNPLTNGFPNLNDINLVANYIDTVRPVTVRDFYCEAPLPFPISFTINQLTNDDQDTYGNIVASVEQMLFEQAAPASSLNGSPIPPATIYAAWVSDAILQAAGVTSFDLVASDFVPPNNGSMAVLGSVVHGTPAN